jgi:hypothetical protein
MSFESIPRERLVRAHGGVQCNLSGLPASARSIIMAESGGESASGS